jgi:hypothetical protein
VPALIGVLSRLKFGVVWHSMTGARATWMMTGGLVGLALAAGTLWLSIQPEGEAARDRAAPGEMAGPPERPAQQAEVRTPWVPRPGLPHRSVPADSPHDEGRPRRG